MNVIILLQAVAVIGVLLMQGNYWAAAICILAGPALIGAEAVSEAFYWWRFDRLKGRK